MITFYSYFCTNCDAPFRTRVPSCSGAFNPCDDCLNAAQEAEVFDDEGTRISMERFVRYELCDDGKVIAEYSDIKKARADLANHKGARIDIIRYGTNGKRQTVNRWASLILRDGA